MNVAQFIALFEESVLDVPAGTIQLDSVLDELEEWDSMARVALNAVLDSNFGIMFSSDELKELKTFSDIVQKLDGRLDA